MLQKRKPVTASVKPKRFDASLPAKNSTPMQNMHDFTFLVYGEPKIGKTSFASQFDDVFFMFFEPGGKSITARQKYIPSWRDALKVLDELEANPSYCKLVVIDTGFAAFERCFDYALEELKIDKPSDGDWGEAWKRMDKEFKNFHERIFAMGLGFIVTAHSELVTIKKKSGLEQTKIRTMLGKQAWRFYNGIVDVIAYYEYDCDGGRQMTIRGNADLEAGCRISNHFRYADTKEMIESIPMGSSEEEAYTIFQKAFENKLRKNKEEPATKNTARPAIGGKKPLVRK